VSETLEVLLATGNRHKLREIREMLEGTRYRVVSLADIPDAPEIIEDGDTFRANADKKARTLARHCDRVTVADDSGIEVDALNGAPGVHSARFAGGSGDDADDANNQLLIEKLRDVPYAERTARFRCALAIVHPDGRALYSDGTVEGHIASEEIGEGGFGYDPLFLLAGDPQGRTTAQLSPAEKNAVSHRGQALNALLPLLDELSGS
jgi:XTP/dITP diphosphohydrolase